MLQSFVDLFGGEMCLNWVKYSDFTLWLMSIGWHNTILAWCLVFLGCCNPSQGQIQRIFSYVIDDKISVLDFLHEHDYTNFFQLPLSVEAMEECRLLEGTQNLPINNTANDNWLWSPGKGNYSAKSFYTTMHAHMPADEPCKWIWESRSIMKIKVFAWLMLNDRLNTRDLLTRKNFYIESSICVLCDDEPNEYMKHLFFSCDFSQNFGYHLDLNGTLIWTAMICLLKPKT